MSSEIPLPSVGDGVSETLIPKPDETCPDILIPEIEGTSSEILIPQVVETSSEMSAPEAAETSSELSALEVVETSFEMPAPETAETSFEMSAPKVVETKILIAEVVEISSELSAPEVVETSLEISAPEVVEEMCIPDVVGNSSEMSAPNVVETSSEFVIPEVVETSTEMSAPEVVETSEILIPEVVETFGILIPAVVEASSEILIPEVVETSTGILIPEVEEASSEILIPEVIETSSEMSAPEFVETSSEMSFEAVEHVEREVALNYSDQYKKMCALNGEIKEKKYRAILEAWVRPEVMKARRKLAEAKLRDERYKEKQHMLYPGSQPPLKKISQKSKDFRSNYTGFFEIQNALGSSSEISEVEDFVQNPERPESSTSAFDLDSDDVHPTQKVLFDQFAEYEKKKIKIVHKKKEGKHRKASSKDSQRSGQRKEQLGIGQASPSAPLEEPRKVLMPEFRTHTDIRTSNETSSPSYMPLPILPEIKKRSVPFELQPNALERFAEARGQGHRPLSRAEQIAKDSYKLYAETPESFRMMMGYIPGVHKKIQKPVCKGQTKPIPMKASLPMRAQTPMKPQPQHVNFVTQSTIPKLPSINPQQKPQKCFDNYPSSSSGDSARCYQPGQGQGQGLGHGQPNVLPAKLFRRPINHKPQPIWLPEQQPKDPRQECSLRMPLEDGTVQYWRPRENVSWLHQRCDSAQGERKRDPEARYSCEPVAPSRPGSVPLDWPKMSIVRPTEALNLEQRQAKAMEERIAKFEAQERVVKFVAPGAAWNKKYPEVRPEQINLGEDEILAKISYAQYDIKSLEEQGKHQDEFKGHLIVRIVRVGEGTQFQEGLVPGVLAWARYGKGQRLKARFMADNVDFFIYQLEHLSYFYNDADDEVVLPSICLPPKYS